MRINIEEIRFDIVGRLIKEIEIIFSTFKEMDQNL
jgi:hypothetical protein